MTESKSYLTAVALAYREGQIAPKVVAKGRGLIAEEIIKRAKESGIYVHESTHSAATLCCSCRATGMALSFGARKNKSPHHE